MYASDAFGALGQWLRDLLNGLTAGSSNNEKQQLRNYFLTSSRYEYLFWEMSYNQEKWEI